MTMYYHVTDHWDGGDLESLVTRIGENEGYDAFLERWPDAGELTFYHANRVHLFDSLEKAERFCAAYGDEILIIDGEGLDIDLDTLETNEPHYSVLDKIPANNIHRYG